MQEGSKAAMPIVSKYLGEWKDRLDQEMKDLEKTPPKKPESAAPGQN
jgi:hypothetical protein